jgi:diphthamide biosynthesis protein 7
LKPDGTGHFSLTLSTGKVAYVQIKRFPKRAAEVLHHCMISHEGREAWCAVFGNDSRWLYSGGDDASLRLMDTATRTLSQPGKANYTAAAGITSILLLPLPRPFQSFKFLLIGSYSAQAGDRNLRVYYHENIMFDPTKGRTMSEGFAAEGGVWRLSMIPDEPPIEKITLDKDHNSDFKFRVLASCMHAGAQVLEVRVVFDNASEYYAKDDTISFPVSHSPEWEPTKLACRWTITKVAEFTEHESMCYGGIAQALPGTKETRCATISFYDRKLCIWMCP